MFRRVCLPLHHLLASYAPGTAKILTSQFMLSFHHRTAELKILAYMNGYANVLAFNQYHLHGKRTFLSCSQNPESRGCDLIIIFAQNEFYEIRSRNLYDNTPVKQQYNNNNNNNNSYHNKNFFSSPLLEGLSALSLRSSCARLTHTNQR